MKKTIQALFFTFMFLILFTFSESTLAADLSELENAVCIGGNLYDVTSMGSKVGNKWSITTDNLTYMSMLPSSYFKMKEYIERNNINLNAQDNGFFGDNTEYWKYTEFLRIYGDTYRTYGVNQPEEDYAFVATSLNRKCIRRIVSGKQNWESCPTDEMMAAGYYSTNFDLATGEFQFDQDKKQFYLDIKDSFLDSDEKNFSFDGTIMVRVVRNGESNLEEYEFNSLKSINNCPWDALSAACVIGTEDEVYNIPKNGNVRVYFDRDAEVNLEFYLKSNYKGNCEHSYLGYVRTSAPDSADVANTWLDSTICKNFKENKNISGETVTSYSNITESAKRLLVPECFQETIEYFTDVASAETHITEYSISQNIAKAVSIYGVQRTGANLSNGLQCHYHPDGSWEGAEETIPFDYNPNEAKYWYASCYETTKVTYDQPKKVISGAGFSYETVVEVTRTCTPVPIVVTAPAKCKYAIECWGGPAHHTGEGGAGPSEDFDACVDACDGGEYSQDCINQCYKSVYENNLVDGLAYNSFLDVMKNYTIDKDSSNSSTVFLANDLCAGYTTKNMASAPNYCYEINNWYTDYELNKEKTKRGRYIVNLAAKNNKQSNCDGVGKCWSLHGIRFTYANGCNSASNPTYCYEVYKNKKINKFTDPYCSDNPSGDYVIEKQIAQQEYNALIEALQTYDLTETFEMQITDSYKKDGNELLKTTFEGDSKTLDTNLLKVEGGVSKYDNGKTYKVTGTDEVVYATNKNVDEKMTVSTIEVKKTYTVNLPQTYISQLTGEERYAKVSESKNDNERNAGNKYYTDIKSGTYNDYRSWGTDGTYYPTTSVQNRTGNNIFVKFYDVGTKLASGNNTWESIPIDCFYGVLNQRYIECEDNICDNTCNPETDICTGGLQYYFRQINLNDVFPNRSPRWNWTSYASVYDSGYAVNPVEVTEQIERDGNSILTDTPDYEITLTRENIREIRSKNKGLNYQEYFDGMTCDLVNGMEVCKSNIDSSVDSIIRNTELGENE